MGCAAGYGVGYQSSKITVSDNDVETSNTVSMAYQEFRIVDTTGILLAAMVSMGRQYNARAEAIEAAEYKTPDADGKVTVEYSYEPMPILSGLLTDLRFRIPLSTATFDDPTGMTDGLDASYWGFDLRSEFYTFRPVKSLPMVSSLWLNVEAGSYKAETADFNAFTIDLGGGASTSYVFNENLTATGRVKLGLISPLLGLVSSGSLLHPSAEVEVGFRPWSSDKVGVMLSGVAYLGREFVAEAGGRGALVPRIGVNATLTFGNQVPKKARRPDPTPAGAAGGAPQTGLMSGVICLGNDAPAECKQVTDAIPEAPKLLYAACAQATVTAANASPPDFSTQPNVCRTAGAGIHNFLDANDATLDATTKRMLRIAAASAFDLAGVGYEVTQGKLGADHCAMHEAVFTLVVGPERANPTLPTRVHVTDTNVQQCRPKFECRGDDAQGIVCTPKVDASVAPAASPAP